MSGEHDEIGDIASVHLVTAGEFAIDPHDFDYLDARYNAFVAGGKVVDEVIRLDAPSGGTLVVAVSEIRGLFKTTRLSRERGRARSLALEAEARADGIIDP